MNTTTSYKYPVIVWGCFFFLACMQAAPLGQNSRTILAQMEPELRYRLIVLKPSVCQNEGIMLEVELQNTRDHKISINPRVLFHEISISRDGGATSSTGDLMGPKVRPDQTVDLTAGQSYRKTIQYSLKDKFFSLPGIYSIQVSYGQFTYAYSALPDLYAGVVESNKVLFEIKDCEETRQGARP